MHDHHLRRDPKYRLHKQSAQAIVTLPDGLGGRKDVLLGKHDTSESWDRYYRVVAEWRANGCTFRKGEAPADDALTVNELILLFWRHAEQHYRHPDGTPTSELAEFCYSLRPLKELYGHDPAREFGPKALKATREAMVGKGWCRGVVNQRVGRVKRVFKWAVSEELIPAAVLLGLQAVKGLQRGRTDAREAEPVGPVPAAFVEAVLPLVTPQVAAMIRLQALTGMRPGETTRIRGADLDVSGEVWLYRPRRHKTAWRGKARVVPLGARAQELLRPWLRLNLEEYLFQPREAMAAFRAAQRDRRKSKVQPSQRDRSEKRPKKLPGEHYSVESYGRAIEVAARRAGVPPWNPNQLRHNHATEVRRRFGLEAAQVTLGHSKADVTQVYAERDQALAERVARDIG